MLKKSVILPLTVALVAMAVAVIAAPWIRSALNPQPLPPKTGLFMDTPARISENATV